MKKKIVLGMLMACTLCFTGCESEEGNDPIVSQPETTVQETEASVAESTVAESKESVVEETKETNNAGAGVTVEEDENGYKTYYTDDESYLEAYKQFMMDNLNDNVFELPVYEDDYLYNELYYSPEFCLDDINGDGIEELIIQGALGLRSKMYTTVVFVQDGALKVMEFDGCLDWMGSGMIAFNDGDYALTENGEEIYYHDYIVSFDENADPSTVIEYSECEVVIYVDENDTEGVSETLYAEYYVDGSEVNGQTYASKEADLLQKMDDDYELKTLNEENIEKYVVE